MDSPLSFNSTENFRKKLLIKNLKPYTNNDNFNSGDSVIKKEYQIVDYAVKDSEDIINIGNRQETELYKQNKYGPTDFNSSYGDSVLINLNLNVETNFGMYGFKNAYKSNLENVGDRQEKILYVNNIYGPTNFNSSYGNTIDINKKIQTKSNLGDYGYFYAIDSKLERIGVIKETELILNNLYKPTNLQYGNTVWSINNNKTISSSGSGEYNISDTNNSYLNTVGNQQEIIAKVRNVYSNNFQPGYGSPVYSINNLQTILTNGSGEYTISDTDNSYLNIVGNQQEIIAKTRNVYKNYLQQDYGDPVYSINNLQTIETNGSGLYLNPSNTIGSNLETKGNVQESVLRVINKYTPNSGNLGLLDYGTTKWSINNVQTLGSNEGEYDISDTIGSDLEIKGNTQEIILRVINKYTPNSGDDYGMTKWSIVNNVQPLGSNEGEYDFSDSMGSNLETKGNLTRTTSFVLSQYGPEFGQSTQTIFPFTLLNNNTNEGNYGLSDSDNSLLEIGGEIIRPPIFILNEYQPANFPNDSVVINSLMVNATNKGEYDTSDSEGSDLEVIGTQKEIEAYVKNKYVTGLGTYNLISIDEIIPSSLGQPYALSLTPINFIPSTYKAINILLSDNPKGSNGSLSQDSNLAFIGAKQLKKEYKYRIASELLSQTLGRINALDSSIDPDSGGVSVKPNLNPFDVMGIVSGNIPLLARNYTITSPESIVGRVLNFAAKLGGLYSPYSIIPGEYFDYPNKRMLNRLVENPIGLLTTSIASGIRKITGQGDKRGSKLLLANTSNATRSLLFGQLFYNNYRPDYQFLTVRRPTLFAPKPQSYGGGKDGNEMVNLMSPIDAQPVGRDGTPTGAQVYPISEMGKFFEGDKDLDLKFGLNSQNYTDGTTPISGGFTWTSKKSYFKPGVFVGLLGKKENRLNTTFTTNFQSALVDTFSYKIEDKAKWKEGSILYTTQKLIDSADSRGVSKLKHVGTAINQISKVFNDGYVELTKGSRVISYRTKNSENKGSVKGYEYCRLFTKDRPYMSYLQLQKIDGNIRKYNHSVLDNTFNLNISPLNDKNGTSTNIVDGRVKKYMFSIENLAWRTSNKKGFTYDDLPACEKGPNGGRIMWFPPYNLDFGEDTTTSFDTNKFIGRSEPIYTYQSTERGGTVDFSIIVDHPSISNLLVDQEFKDISPESETNKVLSSFFAGCLKYDIYTLGKRFAQFTPNDIQEAINLVKTVEEVKLVVDTQPASFTSIEETTTTIGDDRFKEMFLFFENNEPTADITDENYEYWFDSYTANQSNYDTKPQDIVFKYDNYTNILNTTTTPNFSLKEYVDTRNSSINKYFNLVTTEFDELKDFLGEVGKVLDGGGEVSFTLYGTASSTNVAGNQRLSERRNKSVLKYIEEFTYNNKKLSTFSKLKIKTKATGSSDSDIKDPNLSNMDCSKAFKDPYADGIYSVQAMACRRTKIGDLKFKEVPPKPDEPKPVDGVLPKTNINPAPNPTPPIKNFKDNPYVKDLAKRLLRRLLTECNYFQRLKSSDPFVYDNMKSKFKYFNPIFHSITPEGLNSRLTFLQQCMRPGDTIPTVTQTAAGTLSYDYNDAFNSAFGAPPVLVLRIGDFFNTKIIPENISFKYEEGKFDLNPEGIGIQPMKCDVTLKFKFIGGQGLAAPVAELQNALSFNYYANTEMYDERATVTEDISATYDQEFYDEIKNRPKDKIKDVVNNKMGTTIGAKIEQTFDATINGFVGKLSYEKNMKDLLTISKSYANSVNVGLKKIKDELLIGGLCLFTKDRQFQNGYFNTTTNLVKIFGKSDFESKVSSLFSKIKEDIENETTPLLAGIELQNFTNSSKRKVKRNLKKIIEDNESKYLTILNDVNKSIVDNQVGDNKMIDIVDQMNFVCNGFDGYTTKNEPIIFSILGTTPVDNSNTSYGNTLLELSGDLVLLGNSIKTIPVLLETKKIIPTTVEDMFNDTFNFNMYMDDNPSNISAEENRTFMVFGKNIIDDADKFIESIIKSILNNDNKTEWTTFLKDIIKTNANSLLPKYIKSKKYIDDNFKSFEEEFNKTFCASCKTIFTDNKKRIFTFSQLVTPGQTEIDGIKSLSSNENSTGDDYNLKNSFK